MDLFGRDKTPEARALIVERYRNMSAAEKLQMMADLNALVTQTQLNAVRRAHPDADEREVNLRVASRWVRNHELLKRAFGWDVAEKGY